jgi:lysophospholipase L1-like esterase
VVVGDSIPLAEPCPDCTHFTDQLAAKITAQAGHQVVVTNRARGDSAGVPQIVTQVTTDVELRAELTRADIVVLSVGFNNALPDIGNPPPGGLTAGCDKVAPGSSDATIGHIVATTPSCNAKAAEAFSPLYDTILDTMTGLRQGKPTVYLVLNAYDGNISNPDIKAALDPKTFATAEKVIVNAYDTWNQMLCARVKAHNMNCVDIYHAVNGPRGDKPSFPLTVDGAHPNQKGNDLIAELLERSYTTAAT